MMVAQKLYEGLELDNGHEGLITYMRTDSVNLSVTALDQAKQVISERFGKEICTGPKGSLLLFDPDTVHGSSFSYEDFSRKLLILTFNVCSNKPRIPTVRPDYLCSTDFTPLQWN